MKKLILTTVIFLAACTKTVTTLPVIDLGVKSTSTAITSITQENSLITVEFAVTPGAKYSVQIVPFTSLTPVFTEGFTANSNSVVKIYNLSKVPKNDYNLIFIDISGKEVKYPLIIK